MGRGHGRDSRTILNLDPPPMINTSAGLKNNAWNRHIIHSLGQLDKSEECSHRTDALLELSLPPDSARLADSHQKRRLRLSVLCAWFRAVIVFVRQVKEDEPDLDTYPQSGLVCTQSVT